MNLPQILTTTDGKEHLTDPISNDLVKNRTIYLFDEINTDSAAKIISQLALLDRKNYSDIYIIINSPGGSISDGLAIYDMLNHMQSDIVTIATGMAASMGSFLLAAGTKGKRYASPTAEIMIHQPLGGVQGQATDISLVADHIQQRKKLLANILANECDKKVNSIIKDMERDYWMTPKQALDYGVIDHIGFPEEWL